MISLKHLPNKGEKNKHWYEPPSAGLQWHLFPKAEPYWGPSKLHPQSQSGSLGAVYLENPIAGATLLGNLFFNFFNHPGPFLSIFVV